MNTGLIHEYAAYGHWANARFVERLSREAAAVLDTTVASSFPSLRATLLHIRDAENAWTLRLLGEPSRWPADPSPDLATIMPFANRFKELVLSYSADDLLAEHAYKDLKGNTHASPAWRMIMHCINHGTQHRGQLITMMRGLGLGAIPANDLVVFQRSVLRP
jgi:uncharacterized damage-inducible protein DinB